MGKRSKLDFLCKFYNDAVEMSVRRLCREQQKAKKQA
jgi:hypothetical protein